MASEDSDQLVPGFPSVHRLHDLDDLRKTSVRLVATFGHELDARRKLLEVEPLRRTERILAEERDYPFKQILSTTNDITVEVLPVVVMPPVYIHPARSKELAQIVEAGNATRSLRHDEVV